ncbi:MAG: hypothetical protein A2Z18_08730 [Armatimonadetes bacterium RBG_16_58_9]|nr:MAG: hypothetical protein A2Z18_08730 [Armatimonadetes bacterium RBG_16_58_9]
MSIRNQVLAAVIRDRLLEDGRIAALAIDVSCADGFVRLVGNVDTAEQRDLAVELITGMVGVRNVEEELLVREAAMAARAESSRGGLAAA